MQPLLALSSVLPQQPLLGTHQLPSTNATLDAPSPKRTRLHTSTAESWYEPSTISGGR